MSFPSLKDQQPPLVETEFIVKLLCNDLCREKSYTNKLEFNFIISTI